MAGLLNTLQSSPIGTFVALRMGLESANPFLDTNGLQWLLDFTPLKRATQELFIKYSKSASEFIE